MFFWKQKWQILINATLSGSAHGGRGVAELGGGGWLPVLFSFFLLSRPELSLPLRLKPFHSLVSAPTFFFPFLWLMRSSSLSVIIVSPCICAALSLHTAARVILSIFHFNLCPFFTLLSLPVSLSQLRFSYPAQTFPPFKTARRPCSSILSPNSSPSFPASSPPARWSVRRRFLPSLHHSLAQFQCF